MDHEIFLKWISVPASVESSREFDSVSLERFSFAQSHADPADRGFIAWNT